jgi:glutamate synthase domain-containing protein 3
LLADWARARREFVLVMPHEYRRALSELEATAIAAE